MKGLVLLCGLLAGIQCIVYKESLKFYVSENFRYMGKFIGDNQSRANSHFQLLAKFKRPIESLHKIDPKV